MESPNTFVDTKPAHSKTGCNLMESHYRICRVFVQTSTACCACYVAEVWKAIGSLIRLVCVAKKTPREPAAMVSSKAKCIFAVLESGRFSNYAC